MEREGEMGKGRWGREDGERGTEGETGTSSAYKRLVFVCLSIKLGVQLKLNASVYQRNEINMERSTFLLGDTAGIICDIYYLQLDRYYFHFHFTNLETETKRR